MVCYRKIHLNDTTNKVLQLRAIVTRWMTIAQMGHLLPFSTFSTPFTCACVSAAGWKFVESHVYSGKGGKGEKSEKTKTMAVEL